MIDFEKDKHPFFYAPTQVVFFDVDGTNDLEHPRYIAGIAYHDEIICGCCGGIFQIPYVWEVGIDAGVQPIFVYDDWVDLNEAITGDTDLTNMPVIADDFFAQIDQYIPKDKHPNN